MKLYFVRHGQSMGNMTGDYSTIAHDQLSAEGHRQAARLATRLTADFQAIYVSPLQRAMETCLPFLKARGYQAELWSQLAEACWQLERAAPIPPRLAPPEPLILTKEWQPYFIGQNCGQSYLPYPDEVFKEGLVRLRWVKDELLRRHGGKDETVLLVSHWYFGSHLIDLLLQLPCDDAVRFHHDNTGLTLLDQRADGSFFIEFVNRVN